MARPFPITRYLVGTPLAGVAEGHTAVQSAVLAGLPHVISLSGELRLMLVLPTGLARRWQAAPPATLVASSTDEDATSEDGDASAVLPFRLLVQRSGRTVGALPLVRDVPQLVEESGADGRVRIEVILTSWALHAGVVVGPGDFGSRIALSWRAIGDAVPQFSTPPPNPQLIPRLPPSQKTESRVGILKERFRYSWAAEYREQLEKPVSRTRYVRSIGNVRRERFQ